MVAVNEALEDAPELINEDPYGNWIIKVKMSDPGQLDSLSSAADYAKTTE